jgi:hypothetical protein
MAARIRTGNREPSAAMVATKMTVMAAEMPVAAAVPVVTTAMSMATAMPMATTVTTAFAERHARKQGRQNEDHNSDCRFGHGPLLGTLLCAARCCSATTD